MRSNQLCAFITVLVCTIQVSAQSPATAPAGKLPHIQVDVKKRQVRVDCEALNVDIPLEFFCVTAGGNEHESILRTPARPSHIHLALLMLGSQPGEPIKFSESAQKWFPPHGPPLHISVEYQKDGKTVDLPANRLMRSVKTKRDMPPMTWIFAGSRVLDDGTYGADPTGYVVSICNFDLCLIDVPALVSSANETLEWERNPDTVPPTGTPVTMIIEPAGADKPADAVDAKQSKPPAVIVEVTDDNKIEIDHLPVDIGDLPARLRKLKSTDDVRLAMSDHANPDFEQRVKSVFFANVPLHEGARCSTTQLSDVHIDQPRIDRLQQRWNEAVRPHDAALREAAQAQYEVITELRREQQRLIDEADRIQRKIDELEKQYQDMTTPRPEAASTQGG
ncbi:MAG: hypothetical protein JO353_13290 [Phycisphaerae bacterium]|nr:hypothetical protein [Phycisphaerae bacterium]